MPFYTVDDVDALFPTKTPRGFGRRVADTAEAVGDTLVGIGGATGRAAFRTVEGLTGALEATYGQLSGNFQRNAPEFRRRLRTASENLFPYSEAAQKAEREGRQLSSPAWMAEHGADIVADLGAMLYGAKVGGTRAGMAVAGAQTGLSTRNESYDRLRAKGYDEDSASFMATTEGLLAGGTTAIVSKLPLDMLKRVPNTVRKTVWQSAAAQIKELVASGAAEGAEEVIEGATNDLVQAVMEKDPKALEGFWQRRKIEGVLGAIAGGGVRGTVGAQQFAADYSAKAADRRMETAIDEAKRLFMEGDMDALYKLGENPNPTRSDLEAAGFDVGKLKLNKGERAEVAGWFSPENRAIIDEYVRESLVEPPQEPPVPGTAMVPVPQEEAPAVPGREAVVQPETPPVIPLPQGPQAVLPAPTKEEAAGGSLIQDPLMPAVYQSLQETGGVDRLKSQLQQQWEMEDQQAGQKRARFGRRGQPAQLAGASPVTPLTPDRAETLARIDQIAQSIQVSGGQRAMPQILEQTEQQGRPYEQPAGPEAAPGPVQGALPGPTWAAPVEAAPSQPPPGPAGVLGLVDAAIRPGRTVDSRAAADAAASQLAAMGVTKADAIQALRAQWAAEDTQTKAAQRARQQEKHPTALGARVVKPITSPKMTQGRKTILRKVSKVLGDIEARMADQAIATIPQPAPAAQTAPETPAAQTPPASTAKTAVSPQRDIGITAWVQGQLRSRGRMPEFMFEAQRKARGFKKSETMKAALLANDVISAAREGFGRGKGEALTADDEAKIDNVLQGVAQPESLPEVLRAPVAKLRAHADSLSSAVEAMLRDQLAKDPENEGLARLIETVVAHRGTYLHRSYKAFNEKGYEPTEEAREAFRQHLASEFPDALPNQIENEINFILKAARESGNIVNFLGSKNIGSKDTDTLKRRHTEEELPEVYRKFLGQYNDLNNYGQTITKVANLVAQHNFLTDVRKQGLGTFFFEPGDPNIPPDADTEISAKGNASMEPLDGLRTFPEIAEAMKVETVAAQERNPLANAFFAFEGLARKSKTVWSVKTQVRNIASNPLLLLANGQFPGTTEAAADFHRAMQVALAKANQSIETKDGKDVDPTLRKELEDAVKYLVIGESVDLGMIQDMPHWESKWASNVWSTAESVLGKQGALKAKQVLSAPDRLYAWSDDIFKYYQWVREIKTYSKAHPEWTEEQVKTKAAQIVRDTQPNYSMLGPLAQKFRNTPFGPFIAFRAEAFRNFHNRMSLIQEEWNDPALRGMAAKRFAGQVSSLAAWSAAAAVVARFLSGVDKETEESLREFVAPWSKNATWLNFGKNKRGNYMFIDTSALDPQAFYGDAFRAFMRGDDMWESSMGAIGELFEPFLGRQLVTDKLLDISRNTTETGGKVWDDGDPPGTKAWKAFMHVADAATPGTVTSMMDVWKGYQGRVSTGGKEYDARNELIGTFAGMRPTEIKIPQSLKWNGRALNKKLNSAEYDFTQAATNEGYVSQDELQAAYDESETNRRTHFQALEKQIAAARKFETDDNIKAALKDGGITESIIDDAMAGKYTPAIPGDIATIKKMGTVATEEHRALLSEALIKRIGSRADTATDIPRTSEKRQQVESAWKDLRDNDIGVEDAVGALRRKWLKEAEGRPLFTKARATKLARLGLNMQQIKAVLLGER